MPRINVYVPDELKALMDEAGESANWSSIAQRAFREAALTHLARKDPNMLNVAERLRASKLRFEGWDREKGIECGRNWAKERAEYPMLVKVVENLDCMDVGVLRSLFDPESRLHLDHLQLVLGLSEARRLTDEFAEGFAQGAAEVYDEVSHLL